MYFGFCGIVISMVIVFTLLAIDEITKKDSEHAKTIDLCDGLVHITIPSFDEWCDQTSCSESIPVVNPSINETTDKTTDETTDETTIETDISSILVSYGITKARASILMDAFGENLLIIAKEGGVKELTKLKGIGEATAKKVIAIVNDLDNWADNDGVVSPIII